ncbi:Dabb family protein [Flavicella sp.]|uniref:Dabb family protein n=1 Tax=Flavicella sp. TaxID=2957742 RepID=UPI00261F8337|nr:Dabb family protein [Flavicella sp.]MDG1806114.1 Dabb family protein [Flavicella sp.]
MYKHVVLWKLKDSVGGENCYELSKEVKRRLQILPDHISEIIDFEVAINIGDYGASFFDVSLVSTFENRDTFWAYTNYPIHDEVVAYIQSIQEAEHIVDYRI